MTGLDTPWAKRSSLDVVEDDRTAALQPKPRNRSREDQKEDKGARVRNLAPSSDANMNRLIAENTRKNALGIGGREGVQEDGMTHG